MKRHQLFLLLGSIAISWWMAWELYKVVFDIFIILRSHLN